MKHYVNSAIGKDWSKNWKKLDGAASKVDFEKTKSDKWNHSAEYHNQRDQSSLFRCTKGTKRK